MIEVFTPERISPDCPLKSNQRLAKLFDSDSAVCSLTPSCTPQSLTPRRKGHHGAWLRGVMHTVEFFEKLDHLTLQCASHCRLCGMMHTAELDSAVCIIPRFSCFLIRYIFLFSNSLHHSTTYYRKTSEVVNYVHLWVNVSLFNQTIINKSTYIYFYNYMYIFNIL